MGLKVKYIPSLFKVPSCTQNPKTSSFRLTTTLKDDIFKTINSVYVDQESDLVETPDSWFTNSSELGSNMSQSDIESHRPSIMSISEDTHLESIVRGAQLLSSSSNRLMFDHIDEDSPRLGPTTCRVVLQECADVRSLILDDKYNQKPPFKESVAMSMESEDPYEDFKKSMEEMVESLEVKDDWEGLEELLGWYLKVNGRKHHGYIISAFIDLLVGVFDENSSCDESVISDNMIDNGRSRCTNEMVISTTSFCSATSSFISSSGSSSEVSGEAR